MSPAPSVAPALWTRLREHPAVVWRSAHYVSLAAGLVGLLLLARGQWFFFDEWDIMWQPEGLRRLVEGHNGHWSLVPIAVWLLMERIIGLGSYLPYMAVAIVVHLVVAHLLWRLMLRLRVDPWIATAATAVFVFFGAGWENLTWAFQMGFVGAIAFALGALLLVMRPVLGIRGIVGAIVLLLLGVASAGTALPFLPVVLAAAWQRHGWRRALLVVGIPAVVYLGWLVLVAGPNPTAVYRASGVATSLIGIPRFAATMLVGSWSTSTPLPELGIVILAALAVGGVVIVRRRRISPRGGTLLALGGAAVLFAILTAYSRLGLGLTSATEPRYIYVVVLATLPALCVLLTVAVRGVASRLVVLALIAVVFVYNVGLLGGAASSTSARELNTRAVISAALALADEHPDAVDGDAQPDPVYVPRTLSQLQILRREDGLQTATFTDEQRLTALVEVGVRTTPATGAADCTSALESGEVLPTADDLVVSAPSGGTLALSLRESGTTGASRSLDLADGATRLDLAEPAEVVVGDITGTVLLCSR